MNIVLLKQEDPDKRPTVAFVPHIMKGGALMPLLSARNLPLRFRTLEQAITGMAKRSKTGEHKFKISYEVDGQRVEGNLVLRKPEQIEQVQ